MKIKSHGCDINRPRPRDMDTNILNIKCVSQYNDDFMY